MGVILRDDHWCFGCGEDNPIGLHLQARFEGEALVAEFTPQKAHQGYAGIMHGGIMSALLDEMMGKLLAHTGRASVTAEITVRFRRPVMIGQSLSLRAWVEQERGRVIIGRAEARNGEGAVCGEATATFVRQRAVPGDRKDRADEGGAGSDGQG